MIVDSVKDCYGALGSIHALWRPVQGRFKDYIAMPKFNLYQSLHTTVVGPQGRAVEFQIRTSEMHRRSEYGVAAHWGYKEQRNPAEDLVWLQRIVDWQKETTDPTEFMQSLKIDLEQDEVFVFTPKGRVITLPTGATPVDFAYAIHTEVGHRCIGARVNGRLVPLDSALQSGDTCEIFTSKVEGAGPSRDWTQFVQTPRASSKIRQWFSRERRVDAIDQGRDDLVKAMRREALPAQKLFGSPILAKVAEQLHYADLEGLYVGIGEGHVSAKAVVQRIQRELRGGEEQLPTTVARPPRARGHRRTGAGVHVEGLDDVMVRLSRCCTPVPGDEIMGFVTRGRGVSVHRTDCANAVSLASQADRVIDVEWDNDSPGNYTVSVDVEALDRSKLLRDVADVLSEHHVNIISCTSQTAIRPDRPLALRVRAGRSRSSRLDPRRGQAGRFGIRGGARAPGQQVVALVKPHRGRSSTRPFGSLSRRTPDRPIPCEGQSRPIALGDRWCTGGMNSESAFTSRRGRVGRWLHDRRGPRRDHGARHRDDRRRVAVRERDHHVREHAQPRRRREPRDRADGERPGSGVEPCDVPVDPQGPTTCPTNAADPLNPQLVNGISVHGCARGAVRRAELDDELVRFARTHERADLAGERDSDLERHGRHPAHKRGHGARTAGGRVLDVDGIDRGEDSRLDRGGRRQHQRPDRRTGVAVAGDDE